MNFANRAAQLSDTIIADRRYLHQHAELSFEEHETTAYLVSELQKMGIPVIIFENYTGCIAVIEGGKPGKTVMLRADIDALPIQENSGVDFESVHPGVMHACGHDCHAAMLLGGARLLWEQRERLQGTVKLLFQAAEEVFIGSHYYWDEGYLNDVDAAMGMHVWPSVKSGQMVVKDGPLMASCDNFKLTVHGVSAHGSMPHQGKDAIVAASAIITNFQTIVSRSNDPRSTLVVTVGMVHAGTQFNIITDTAVMEGTIRSHSAQARAMVEGVMRLPDLYVLNEMTPRVRITGVEATLPDAEKVRLAEESEYPFLPVYRNDMDHVEGFLDTERLLTDPSRNVAAAIDEPLRVSEHQGLDDLLVLFMKTGRRIALVEDRWGGTAGIITRGDILELIVKPVVDDEEDDD